MEEKIGKLGKWTKVINHFLILKLQGCNFKTAPFSLYCFIVFMTVTLGGDTVIPATVGFCNGITASQTMAVLYSSVLEPLTVLLTKTSAQCQVARAKPKESLTNG